MEKCGLRPPAVALDPPTPRRTLSSLRCSTTHRADRASLAVTEKALILSPNNADVLVMRVGRSRRSVRQARAGSRDCVINALSAQPPLPGVVPHPTIAYRILMGQYDEAIRRHARLVNHTMDLSIGTALTAELRSDGEAAPYAEIYCASIPNSRLSVTLTITGLPATSIINHFLDSNEKAGCRCAPPRRSWRSIRT